MNGEHLAEILNDLVQINNDRIAGYEDAITQLDEGYDNLRELFRKMINESKVYNDELTGEIVRLQGQVFSGTSGAGKLYRAWMDIKAAFSGGSAKSILNTCETIESATLRAYEDALEEEGLIAEAHILISKQKISLLESHSQIKQLLEIASA